MNVYLYTGLGEPAFACGFGYTHSVELNGFEMEIALAPHMAFLTYTDRPGIVGVVGEILGGHGINIAGMQVCRNARGGQALIVLTIDSALPPDLLDKITAAIGAVSGRTADLDED